MFHINPISAEQVIHDPQNSVCLYKWKGIHEGLFWLLTFHLIAEILMFKDMHPSLPIPSLQNAKIALGTLWVQYEKCSFLQNSMGKIGLKQHNIQQNTVKPFFFACHLFYEFCKFNETLLFVTYISFFESIHSIFLKDVTAI